MPSLILFVRINHVCSAMNFDLDADDASLPHSGKIQIRHQQVGHLRFSNHQSGCQLAIAAIACDRAFHPTDGGAQRFELRGGV
jgi:hypothetical protein